MDNFKAVILRINQTEFQTRSNILFYTGDSLSLRLPVLELPWKDNQRGISCIPDGTYTVDKFPGHYRFGNCFLYRDVPERKEVFIHGGNFTSEIRGCQLPGTVFQDINKDGQLDITNSRTALATLYSLAPKSFEITILTIK